MLPTICLLIALIASTAGSLCGIGGGILMKPVLDLTGMIGIAEGSLLSGCTVLAMALISLYKRCICGTERPDLKRALPLALGAIAGGYLGKLLFHLLCTLCGPATAGIVQASLLLALTLMSLLYTCNQARIPHHHFAHPLACLAIGLALGALSSLLGIGGGPINLVVLAYLLGMPDRDATLNSLFIIAFSQFASLGHSAVVGDLAQLNPLLLLPMIAGGAAGGWLGTALSQKITAPQERRLFIALMALIMCICAYTVVKLSI